MGNTQTTRPTATVASGDEHVSIYLDRETAKRLWLTLAQNQPTPASLQGLLDALAATLGTRTLRIAS